MNSDTQNSRLRVTIQPTLGLAIRTVTASGMEQSITDSSTNKARCGAITPCRWITCATVPKGKRPTLRTFPSPTSTRPSTQPIPIRTATVCPTDGKSSTDDGLVIPSQEETTGVLTLFVRTMQTGMLTAMVCQTFANTNGPSFGSWVSTEICLKTTEKLPKQLKCGRLPTRT